MNKLRGDPMRSTRRCSALLRFAPGCGSGCWRRRRRSLIRLGLRFNGLILSRPDTRAHPKRGQQVRGNRHRSILLGAPLAGVPNIQALSSEHPAAYAATLDAPPSRSPVIRNRNARGAHGTTRTALYAAECRAAASAAHRGGVARRRGRVAGGEEERHQTEARREAALAPRRRGEAQRREARRMARGTTALRGTTAPRGGGEGPPAQDKG